MIKLMIGRTSFNCKEFNFYADSAGANLEFIIEGNIADSIKRLCGDLIVLINGIRYEYVGYEFWELYLDSENTRVVYVK